MSAARTQSDELYTTLYHLRNARKALLRTGWTNDRDVQLSALDGLYGKVLNAARAAADPFDSGELFQP